MAESEDRKKRKEEGRLQKRQRIDESGGVRPRKNEEGDGSKESSAPKQRFEGDNAASSARNTTTSMDRRPRPKQFTSSGHRFGRVMEIVPCRNKPRYSTLSIALPGSVLSNCQTRELRTLLVGQIARAATIYHVDEIIVFDDKLAKNENRDNGGWRRPRDRDDKRAREARYEKEKAEKEKAEEEKTEEKKAEEKKAEENSNAEGGEAQERPRVPRSDPQTFMARLLQYCECPQYLRRHFFPMHQDLHFAGLLAPVDAPHHVRAEDRSKYREGVVLEKKSPRPDGGSLVNCGIRNRPVEIDRKLAPGIRCTVKLDPKDYGRSGAIKGIVVSPSAPREDDGTFWGYQTRMATSIKEVFDGCPYEGGYDLKIGTSERGDRSVEDKSFKLPNFEHSLIVFGGVAGIEECVDADETIKLPGAQSKKLFDLWLNTCPYQGSRTIRTEEAVLISLAALSTPIAKSSRDTEKVVVKAEVEFSDEAPSDESSDEDDDGSKEEIMKGEHKVEEENDASSESSESEEE